MPYNISSIYRYPVKGLTPENIEHTFLSEGRVIPGDRAFALALAETKFDVEAPVWQAKTNFLMLARDEKLAELEVRYEPDEHRLFVKDDSGNMRDFDLSDSEHRQAFAELIQDHLSIAERPNLVDAPDHSFSDHRNQVISFINLRSIEALSEVVGHKIDPLRFRANVYFDGDTAWQEFDWLGQTFEWAETRLEVTSRIVRCAATNVDPTTAVRDLNIPKTLNEAFAHVDMGIYARVTTGGRVSQNNQLIIGKS